MAGDARGLRRHARDRAPSEAPRSHASTGDPVFNRAWTLLGVPCVTVPHGKGAHGLPLGIQLVGPFDGDTALLGWAHWTAAALGAGGWVLRDDATA
jgi:amidase